MLSMWHILGGMDKLGALQLGMFGPYSFMNNFKTGPDFAQTSIGNSGSALSPWSSQDFGESTRQQSGTEMFKDMPRQTFLLSRRSQNGRSARLVSQGHGVQLERTEFEGLVRCDSIQKSWCRFSEGFSFNGPGCTYLIGEKNGTHPETDPRVHHKQQSMLLFNKIHTGVTVTGPITDFPSRLFFNGEECVLPTQLPKSDTWRYPEHFKQVASIICVELWMTILRV
ncbi:UNVERIFIED_CONTAM: COBRA-like protein 7 [Sesamum angustifolium]|uniref:COBRA-like protein 7 n=1 Tax=Sesamum angustifolium TaxID=2727405 RepID=A0AAW2PBJ4_9LAMI